MITTLKIRLFDNEDLLTYQNYLDQYDIPAIINREIVGTDGIKLTGDFNQYDLVRIWNGVRNLQYGYPMTWKTKDLIYTEILIGVGGNMNHIKDALREVPLFDIYLAGIPPAYNSARDLVANTVSKYITAHEREVVLSCIPKV